MSRIDARLELEHHVAQLLRKGRSQREVSRAMGVSRGLIARLAQGLAAQTDQPQSAVPQVQAPTPRPSKLDIHDGRIKTLLTSYPCITAQRVFEELRTDGYQGGYSIIKSRVRKLRPPKTPTPSLQRPTFGPGGMAEQDWSPYRVQFTDGTHTVHAFLLSLSHSRRRFVDFFEGEDLFALLEGHRRAFEHFGGVPHSIRYDNQKAVVVRREGPDVFYQPRLLAMATHYGFDPEAVRPRKPNDKAFVERDFWDVERSFLNGRTFVDIEDMRSQAKRWLCDVVDQRPHPKRRALRIAEVFANEEAPALHPLPRHAFDTARVVYRLCSIDGFIHWDGNRYSLPYEHVTALLPVRITQDELFVYGLRLACVAHHQLLPRGGGKDSVLAAHRPPRRDSPGAALDMIRDRFLALGEKAGDFLCGLIETHPRSAAYHARRILELRAHFAAPDVAAAMTHALTFRAFSADAVARIVQAHARPRTLDEHVTAETETRLRGFLSTERLEPRDLRTYDVATDPILIDGTKKETPCPTDSKNHKPSSPE